MDKPFININTSSIQPTTLFLISIPKPEMSN
ncbi:hypothetical protein LINPERPRIM_LOCUS30972 [Linum perenne]